MASERITFIGGGNMATSLIGGMIAGGFAPASIHVTDPLPAQRELLSARFGISASDDNAAAAAASDVLVLAVKPQVMAGVVSGLAASAATRQPLVVSIAAGIAEPDLRRWLGYEAAIVRTMPNTPALVGSGITGLYANANVDGSRRELAEGIMRAVGDTVWLTDESLMDAVTAVSGSGPAYFFLLMEHMVASAERLGLPRDAAVQLVLGTALGAARMAAASEDGPEVLRQRVTSPGGTTAAALAAFEAGGMGQLVDTALTAARDRGAELAKTLGSS